ncbi:mitochondrial translocator assembly and maintenance protein 41 [Pseudoscourfieldia marina]
MSASTDSSNLLYRLVSMYSSLALPSSSSSSASEHSTPVGTCMAFAYGSAVFPQGSSHQSSATSSSKVSDSLASSSPSPSDALMTDFLVITPNDARAWHAANLKRNPGHYAGLCRLLGAPFVDFLASEVGTTSVHFNTMVPVNHQSTFVKYGAVPMSAFVEDCLTWRHMYAAGRLQKPVKRVHQDDTSPNSVSAINTAIDFNRDAALAAALLQLPRTFTTHELLQTIVGLSYSGDVRMGVPFAERPTKVHDITLGSMQELLDVYSKHERPEIYRRANITQSGETWTQDASPNANAALLMCLPQHALIDMCISAREHSMMYQAGSKGTEVAKATTGWSEALYAAPPHAIPPHARDAVYGDDEAPSQDAVAESSKAARALAITVAQSGKAGSLVQSALVNITKSSSSNQTFANAIAAGSRWAPYMWKKVSKALARR